MTEIIRKPEFEKAIKKIKDNKTKERVKKQIKKIIESPEHGDFIKYKKMKEKSTYLLLDYYIPMIKEKTKYT